MPDSDSQAYCPLCKGKLTAKKGKIKVWHYAHKVESNCQTKPETDWHREWKGHFYSNYREVIVQKNGRKKIADVKLHESVIEFQHSPISVEEIADRERFYEKMFWVFDLRKQYDNGQFELRFNNEYVTFRWKHPKMSITYCTKPIYLDLGNNLIFRVKKIGDECPLGGWGYIRTKKQFIELCHTKTSRRQKGQRT